MENIAALIVATCVLVLIPGPNVALIVANTLQHGLRGGVFTVLGTTVGIAMQLSLVVAGLAAIIQMAASALMWIKWLGVAYLLYLAVAMWRRPATDLAEIKSVQKRRFFQRGLALAVVNPKVLLFNAAFLPQFLQGASHATTQLMLVTCVYLGVIALGDMLWAVFASSAGRVLRRYSHLRNRLTAVFLFGAGIGMALTRRGS
jgi:threonine/homoserine/homoserine lactone efflux protein